MFGWFVGASGLFTPCRHESPWVLGSPIFRHTQYIHLWIKFYSSCDYHLTGITPNLMNLNSIQQQAKKKKGVDTAAESSSTPMGCPFLKKKVRQVEKSVLWDKRPPIPVRDSRAQTFGAWSRWEQPGWIWTYSTFKPKGTSNNPRYFFNCASTAFAYPELSWIILLFDIYLKITFEI